MKSDKLLKHLSCPFCGSSIEIAEANEEGNEIDHGYVKCECDQYPIINGILYLKKDRTKGHIIELLKKRRVKEASAFPTVGSAEDMIQIINFLKLNRSYGWFPRKILFALLEGLSKQKYKKYSDKSLPFCRLKGRVPYFKHRFASETFWSIYPFVPLLRQKRERILDIGCGVGHSSFVISELVRPDELVSVDWNYPSLLMLKKYFAKEAECICLDCDFHLPFKNEYFSSVFMMDAIHYVNSRSLLAEEFKRVISNKGLLLLLHVHNSLANPHPSSGNPISPSAWKNLFDDISMLYPEKSILEDFLFKNRLDLTREYSSKELESSQALCIVREKDGKLSKVFDDLQKELLTNKKNLIVNPLYEIKHDKHNILERNMPTWFQKEYPLSAKYLPERIVLDRELMKIIRKRTLNESEISQENAEKVEELMKQFVLINVPENYL